MPRCHSLHQSWRFVYGSRRPESYRDSEAGLDSRNHFERVTYTRVIPIPCLNEPSEVFDPINISSYQHPPILVFPRSIFISAKRSHKPPQCPSHAHYTKWGVKLPADDYTMTKIPDPCREKQKRSLWISGAQRNGSCLATRGAGMLRLRCFLLALGYGTVDRCEMGGGFYGLGGMLGRVCAQQQ